ncbi:MAG: hypothetical protein LQ348_005563 [Seirophora lacunosa]|nr:MAG: hypothetical protein LQ348_005563 [Seirophora lacunosa]
MHRLLALRLLHDQSKHTRRLGLDSIVDVWKFGSFLQYRRVSGSGASAVNLSRSYYHWQQWDNRKPVAVTRPGLRPGVEVLVVGSGQIWDDRSGADKRARTEATQESNKRRKLDGVDKVPIYATKFSQEELDAEGRRPKKKVAVMLGYAGSGYKGMQINNEEKTIEGDLFKGLVAAGAISKANADDPKKSSFVRCARTDRGVHAAGNIVSLKMIIEDKDIVKKINEHLPPQIRVWGFEQAKGSFSAYQLCDSRIYEYLIPTYCFLPPHPESFLGRELVNLAKEADDLAGYEDRQLEVSTFWKETEEMHVKPFLDSLDPEISAEVHRALYEEQPKILDVEPSMEPLEQTQDASAEVRTVPTEVQATPEVPNIGTTTKQPASEEGSRSAGSPQALDAPNLEPPQSDSGSELVDEQPKEAEPPEETSQRPQLSPLETALKQLKNTIITAKKNYRIHPTRLARVQSVLSNYTGTHNFHNYTIAKLPRDPSAKRVIKTFTAGPSPILINNTEWLSLKVHGQSFMMHQIRKMVTMAAFIVRCGCPERRMQESYAHEKLTVPKAPSLGLLLERPVFDTYNRDLARDTSGIERGRIGFEKFEAEVQEFKQREIYERIFREEEKDDTFHSFFAALDGVRRPDLLYLSSVGIPAAKREMAVNVRTDRRVESAAAAAVGGSDEESEGGDMEDG